MNNLKVSIGVFFSVTGVLLDVEYLILLDTLQLTSFFQTFFMTSPLSSDRGLFSLGGFVTSLGTGTEHRLQLRETGKHYTI